MEEIHQVVESGIGDRDRGPVEVRAYQTVGMVETEHMWQEFPG